MNKLLTVAIAASLYILASAQTSVIEQIDAKVRRIDGESKKYVRTQQKFYEGTSEGGQMTFYASPYATGKELKKAVVEAYGETGKSQTQLYYDQGELIFASRRTLLYRSPTSVNPRPRIAKTINERVYFAGGKLLKHFIKGVNPTLRPEESAEQILSLSQEVRKAFAEQTRRSHQ